MTRPYMESLWARVGSLEVTRTMMRDDWDLLAWEWPENANEEVARYLLKHYPAAELVTVIKKAPAKELQAVFAGRGAVSIWGALLENPRLDKEVAETLFTKIGERCQKRGKLSKMVEGLIVRAACVSGGLPRDIPLKMLKRDLNVWAREMRDAVVPEVYMCSAELSKLVEADTIVRIGLEEEGGNRHYRARYELPIVSMVGMAGLSWEEVHRIGVGVVRIPPQIRTYVLHKAIEAWRSGKMEFSEVIDNLETALEMPSRGRGRKQQRKQVELILVMNGLAKFESEIRDAWVDPQMPDWVRKVEWMVPGKDLTEGLQARLAANSAVRDGGMLGEAGRRWGIETEGGKRNDWTYCIENTRIPDARLRSWLNPAAIEGAPGEGERRQVLLDAHDVMLLLKDRDWPIKEVLGYARNEALLWMDAGSEVSTEVLRRVLQGRIRGLPYAHARKHGEWLQLHGGEPGFDLRLDILNADLDCIEMVGNWAELRNVHDTIFKTCDQSLGGEAAGWIAFEDLAAEWDSSLGDLLTVVSGALPAIAEADVDVDVDGRESSDRRGVLDER